MKKRLLIDWRGEDTAAVLENVTALEVAAVLLSLATHDSGLGRALLVAAAKYKDLKKADEELKYIKKKTDE
jgi:hypothetical protein